MQPLQTCVVPRRRPQKHLRQQRHQLREDHVNGNINDGEDDVGRLHIDTQPRHPKTEAVTHDARPCSGVGSDATRQDALSCRACIVHCARCAWPPRGARHGCAGAQGMRSETRDSTAATSTTPTPVTPVTRRQAGSGCHRLCVITYLRESEETETLTYLLAWERETDPTQDSTLDPYVNVQLQQHHQHPKHLGSLPPGVQHRAHHRPHRQRTKTIPHASSCHLTRLRSRSTSTAGSASAQRAESSWLPMALSYTIAERGASAIRRRTARSRKVRQWPLMRPQ
jgi:hypothetical protein